MVSVLQLGLARSEVARRADEEGTLTVVKKSLNFIMSFSFLFNSKGITRCEQGTFLYIKGAPYKKGVIIQTPSFSKTGKNLRINRKDFFCLCPSEIICIVYRERQTPKQIFYKGSEDKNLYVHLLGEIFFSYILAILPPSLSSLMPLINVP